MADIKYIITADASGAISSIQKVEETIEDTGKKTERAGGQFSGLWKQIAGGAVVFLGVSKALGIMKSAINGAIEESIEAERVNKNLAVALEMTGRGGEQTAKKFENLASQIQRQTTYNDEAIKSATTLLAQLTKLDDQGLEKATKASIGLASVLGMDLQSAALLVAKAMEGNTAALSRYGFKIDESLPKQQAVNQLLDQLAGLYRRAEEETKTMHGALEQLQNAWRDYLENIGNVITSSPLAAKAINVVTEALSNQTLKAKILNENIAEYRVAISDLEFLNAWKKAVNEADMSILKKFKSMNQLLDLLKKFNGDINKTIQFVENAGREYEGLREALRSISGLYYQLAD